MGNIETKGRAEEAGLELFPSPFGFFHYFSFFFFLILLTINSFKF